MWKEIPLPLDFVLSEPDRTPDWARRERLDYCEPPLPPNWL